MDEELTKKWIRFDILRRIGMVIVVVIMLVWVYPFDDKVSLDERNRPHGSQNQLPTPLVEQARIRAEKATLALQLNDAQHKRLENIYLQYTAYQEAKRRDPSGPLAETPDFSELEVHAVRGLLGEELFIEYQEFLEEEPRP